MSAWGRAGSSRAGAPPGATGSAMASCMTGSWDAAWPRLIVDDDRPSSAYRTSPTAGRTIAEVG
jgi:hypothetical protein